MLRESGEQELKNHVVSLRAVAEIGNFCRRLKLQNYMKSKKKIRVSNFLSLHKNNTKDGQKQENKKRRQTQKKRVFFRPREAIHISSGRSFLRWIH